MNTSLTYSTSLVSHVGIDPEEEIITELALRARRQLQPAVEQLIRTHGLFVAGGYLRSILQGEPPKDLDLFGPTRQAVDNALNAFLAENPDATLVFCSENARTVMFRGEKLQFVRRDCRETLKETVMSFDFTICQAGFYINEDGATHTYVTSEFLHDTADHRLVYANPDRQQAPAAPLRRMLNFVARGFRPSFLSIADTLGVLFDAIKDDQQGLTMAELILDQLEQSRVSGDY